MRPARRVLSPAGLHSRLHLRLPLKIGLAPARMRISGWWLGLLGGRIGLEEEAEEVVAPIVTARDLDIDRGRGLACDETALRLVAHHRAHPGAIVGFSTQRLRRGDGRGERRCPRG